MPRVSVIIPAYNADGHLGAALESVLAQSYEDWEIVVADDGSTDATAEVAVRYAPHVRLVRSPENRGLAATRNLAIEHACGDLLAFLDSDDTWLPEYLAHQVALYDAEEARSPGVGIVCCDALLAEAGRPLGERYSERFGAPQPNLDVVDLLRGNRIFVSALVPRAAVDEAGGFDASLRSVEDLDLWVRILERGYRVVHNPRPLAIYRLAAGTLSRDTLRMARSRQAVYRAALARGRLSPRARREARRALRLERAAEVVEQARRSWRERPLRAVGGLATAAPFLTVVAIERAWTRRSEASRGREA